MTQDWWRAVNTRQHELVPKLELGGPGLGDTLRSGRWVPKLELGNQGRLEIGSQGIAGWLVLLLIGMSVVSCFEAAAGADEDLKARLPRIPPRSPAESMDSFEIIPGFHVEQVAAEPLVFDPVDMAFDENGRMYVAEYLGYSENDEHKPGRIALLEDTDNDGRFDKRTLFADNLSWNAAVTCFDGGVYVGASPDLLYLKDTDGDGEADLREVVISGFGCTNVNQFLNSLRWRLDNRIHAVVAAGGGELRALRWEGGDSARRPTVIQVRRRDISFHPRLGEVRLESSGDQHGMGLDEWGRKFGSANGNHCQMVMFEDRYAARNPYLSVPVAHVNISVDGRLPRVWRRSLREPWRVVWSQRKLTTMGRNWFDTRVGVFSAACGITVYTGNAWPREYYGNLLIAEPSCNLVHRKRLEVDGVGFLAYRTEPDREFLASSENWFRPVQFANAPDGTLYVADMYREIVEHPSTFMADIKDLLDLNSGNDRGRIYRIVPEGFQQPDPPRLGSLSTAELVRLLEHNNGWHRTTAARLLYERQDSESIGPLVRLAAESESPVARMRAMYALDGQGALAAGVVFARLDDPHPRVREHAVRLAEKVLHQSPAIREKLFAMVADEDIRVRYQLAFTLGEIPDTRATAALAAVLRTDGHDRWVRLAVMSSSLGRAGEMFTRLISDRAWCATDAGRASLVELTEQIGRQNHPDQIDDLLRWIERSGNDEQALAMKVVEQLARVNLAARRRLKSDKNPRGGRLLVEVIERAKRLATDLKQPVAVRIDAIRILGLASFDEVGDVLPGLLESRQPQAVQRGALSALGRFADDRVAGIILDYWDTFSPQVQRTATEVLFARPGRLSVLLAAIEEGLVRPSGLDPARIGFLLSYPDEAIRRNAQRLLGEVKLARREEVVAAYRDTLTMDADAARGKAVFRGECSTCHRLEGVGYDLGLPLMSVKDRGAQTILVSMLDPNREVQPQYLNYVVITSDGLSVTGMITAESAGSVTLTRAGGESNFILRENIDQIQNSGLSVMPEGLEEHLSKQQMADLIAYLMSVD